MSEKLALLNSVSATQSLILNLTWEEVATDMLKLKLTWVQKPDGTLQASSNDPPIRQELTRCQFGCQSAPSLSARRHCRKSAVDAQIHHCAFADRATVHYMVRALIWTGPYLLFLMRVWTSRHLFLKGSHRPPPVHFTTTSAGRH